MNQRIVLPVLLAATLLRPFSVSSAILWIEGEKPVRSAVTRHPWWYDKVQKDELSGGDFLSHWDKDKTGEAEYRVEAPQAGDYDLWVRANPIQSRLTVSINAAQPVDFPFASNEQSINIAEDNKPDLRFVAWIHAGKVPLRSGANSLLFRFDSANNHHGMLDCFVLANEPFHPKGKLQPKEIAAANTAEAKQEDGWFAFDPGPDPFNESAIDLRSLNERFAGEHGRIAVRGEEFIHSENGTSERFWAVNGPPHESSPEQLKRGARRLAKYGVNLVRLHGAVFDARGEADLRKIERLQSIVQAMKAEGIYSHISIYFPLWMSPKEDHPYLQGYDGKTHPFVALMFNPDFEKHYRTWWETLLLTRNSKTGQRLVDESALFGVELQNEDSFFFWTFDANRIPDAQLQILERQFGDWLKQKHGSLDAVLAKWGNASVKRDAFAEGRVGFRPLWNMFNEKSARDRDTVQFLFELQQRFYSDHYAFLRKLGFKGLITASNWATASPEVFGPLEKWSYTVTDFIDRHGYFAGPHKGEGSEWSVRNGHTYADRSALRFEGPRPGTPRQFNHPAMDPDYAGKPSMISETTWNRPNRYRTEAPLYLATFGALQGSDGIVHFALDGVDWSVKPGFWMQPWTLMAPSQMGQFPAAALMYRRGLIQQGDVLARITLNTNDLLNLKGTPLPQDASFDELRLKDVPRGAELKPGQRIDPLIHYAGRVDVTFSGEPSRTELKDLSLFVDRSAQMVRSTARETTLDYGKGVLSLNSPTAQGASGNIGAAGTIRLNDIELQSPLDLVHIVLVSLDGAPLATSKRMLLQVMTEERPTGFRTEPANEQLKRIVSVGRNPWQVKSLEGKVHLKNPAKVQPLDFNGYPTGPSATTADLTLHPSTLYYSLTR